MRNTYQQWAHFYSKRRNQRKVWNEFVRVMACVVVFCTTYALILPAITMEQVYYCGVEKHTHTVECYEQHIEQELCCTAASLQVHEHEQTCFDEAGALQCGYYDTVVHTHEEICYDEAENLICQLPAAEEHVHSETCADETGSLICGVVAQLAHQHGQECLAVTAQQDVLVCEMQEHIHEASCASNPVADLETAEDWEKTLERIELSGMWQDDLLEVAKSQIGYEESKYNYQVLADGETKQGYSRYGAWYGIPYGKWDAMFVSFCLEYASIPEKAIPRDSDAAQWRETLEADGLLTEMGASGNLAFWTDADDVTHMGIVTELTFGTDPDTGAEVLKELDLIGGDRDDEVKKFRLKAEDAGDLTYCSLDSSLEQYVLNYPEEAAALNISAELTETVDTNQLALNDLSASNDTADVAETADSTSAKYYFKTVDPKKLETGKNYVIYCVPDSNAPDTYVFLTSLKGCPELTVASTQDTIKPVNIGKKWILTADQLSNYALESLSWQLELPTDSTATYQRLFSVGYDNTTMENGVEKYPGPEYLCFNVADLQTWYSAGNINLNITAANSDTGDAGGYIKSVNNSGLTQISYDSGAAAGSRWTAVDSNGTAVVVYFAEISTVCEHEYTYSNVSGNIASCDASGSASYKCTVCGKSFTLYAKDLAAKVLDYADQLRDDNDDKDDYSKGEFTWDSETKKYSWTYYNGVMMDAFMNLESEYIDGSMDMADFVIAFYEGNLAEDGTPIGYTPNEVDSVPMALALFDLLGKSSNDQNTKYEAAIQYVFDQLWNEQEPLGAEYGGNYWHKEVPDKPDNAWYTWRFGLDGLYMALPFLMEYANALEAGTLTNNAVEASEIYTTVYNRLHWVATTMQDPETGLYHHGWNGTEGNGVFWGRSMGWYALALVDIIDMMPDGVNKTTLKEHLQTLFDGMLRWQDPETGMWYNIVNRKNEPDLFVEYTDENDGSTKKRYNLLETSVSSMMAYAMMKAYNESWVGSEYYAAGLRALNGIVNEKMTDNQGSYSVADTYRSSSVCTTPEEYLQNPYTVNEAKGVGALIMAASPDHEWSDWKVSETQTLADDGTVTEVRTCTICKDTQSRTVTGVVETRTPLQYKLTVVDPENLVDGETYAIYAPVTNSDGTTDYVFLMSNSSTPGSVRVKQGAYTVKGLSPDAIGGSWTVTTAELGTVVDAFTWTADKTIPNGSTGNLLLQANGFDSNILDNNYLSIRNEGSRNVQLKLKEHENYDDDGKGDGRPSYITLTVEKEADTQADADAILYNQNHKDGSDNPYHMILASGDDWKTSSDADEGSKNNVQFTPVAATPVVFAQVEPIYEEVYDLRVLGINGPVEDKEYVIYVPYQNTTGTYDVKFLGSLINPNKNGNFSRGADGVEDSETKLITAGYEWTLEESKMRDFTLKEIKWTVVKVDGDWCLQSVADPTLHLKLVCTNDSGASQVSSTEYDAQGAQYFSLNFTSSGNTADSWYTITTEDGANELRHYQTGNVWQAMLPTYTEDGVAVDATPIYFAEVIDDTPEVEKPITSEKRFVGYEFTTLDPSKLENNDAVVLYANTGNDPDTYTFAIATGTVPDVTVADTGYTSAPKTIGEKWAVTTKELQKTIDEATWIVEKVDTTKGTIWLRSKTYTYTDGVKEYLAIRDTSVQTYNENQGADNGTILKLTINGAGSYICTDQYGKYMYYDETKGDWVGSDTPTTMYFAGFAEKYVDVANGNNYPDAVQTGEPTVNTLRFYNFVETGGKHIEALPGCEFLIKGTTNGYTYTIISGDNPELHLPTNIPDGSYTITEVSAPEGYMRDVEPVRTFTVKTENGRKIFSGTDTIGTFLNHAQNLLEADKVAEVEDYNNRTYQIMLSAESNLRLYQMNPVDVLFVVDQSNSMLFPAGLEPVTGATVNLYRNLGVTLVDEKATSNTYQLNNLMNRGRLDKNTVYYIIADESVTSTVYAIWYNGVDWMYQDASYYAKAYHNNTVGYEQDDEIAIFPVVASNAEQPDKMDITINGVTTNEKVKANGGSLSYSIGDITLGNDIGAAETVDADGVGYKTYQIYTATNEYNRLHYLQDALAHAIHQLADANDDSTVTLIRFTSKTDHEQCIGPYELTPDNVQLLVNAVENIKTDGGTRQDIALEHAHLHLTGGVITKTTTTTDADGNKVETTTTETVEDKFTKGKDYTFTVLITDGAPVLSGGAIHQLGNAESEKGTTDEHTVYGRIKGFGEAVRGESTLMTIGLGMGAVEGGSSVLEQIATGFVAAGQENPNHMILDNAEELMDMLKQLLFQSMKPREKVDLMGDMTDVISDSFYPIAWVDEGQAPSDHQLLTMKDPQDTERDWIVLQAGDWISIEGEFVCAAGTDPLPANAAGQLTVDQEGDFVGDFRITWTDQMIYDCELVWVPRREEVPTGRTIVCAEDNLGKDSAGNPVGRYWFKLAIGDYVYAHGEYAAYKDGAPTKSGTVGYSFLKDPTRQYAVAGQYVAADGTTYTRPHIQWNDYYSVDFDANFQPYTWTGRFYVKAKEDFIGGNAIDTNKAASVSAQENDGDNIDEFVGTIDLPTPTVNVRLLDMNQLSSEVTVFLGDTINAEEGKLATPRASLQDFYSKTVIEKLIADSGDVLNKYNVGEADGLENAVFYLRYAMGRDVSDTEWLNTLEAGGTIEVPYTYDDASSHGPVGYFTFSLEKNGVGVAEPAYEAHEAKQTGQSVETYTLNITYTAYRLGQDGRPEKNVHNADLDGDITIDPGTEVGSEAGTTLPTGLGVVVKNDIHKVHVISGSIEVTKEIAPELMSDEDQTFTFILSREEDVVVDENGDTVLDEDGKPKHDSSKDRTLTVTIPANSRSAKATISGLKRGTYLLSEKISTVYHVESLTVDTGATNCQYTSDGTTATFYIGNDTAGSNVIGYREGVTMDTGYTEYLKSPNGVLGVVSRVYNAETVYSGKVPVEKLWAGEADADHADSEVYLILYEVKKSEDGVEQSRELLKDEDGRALMVKLTAATGWKGEFIVPLADTDDSINDHHYEVREVVGVGTENAKLPGILYDGKSSTEDQILFYEKEAENESIITISPNDYLVEYGEKDTTVNDDGTYRKTLTVTNHRARVLPESGGMGTAMYTISGMLLTAAPLVYGYNQRRKRERGADR